MKIPPKAIVSKEQIITKDEFNNRGIYMKKLFIIGSGGFCKQVIEIIEKLNIDEKKYNLLGLIDDNDRLLGSEVLGYKVLGTTDYLMDYSKQEEVYGVIAIANGKVRAQINQKLTEVNWINLIHPNAVISNYIEMGKGNIICAGVVINPECLIENHCHINIGTTIGHDVKMKDFVTIMPGSRISGNVEIKKCSLVGTGSTIIQGLSIEENVIIGAGAVVTKNTSANSLYKGVPAKRF
ncbi:acetyltransferase [Psychrobacillus sp. FJAT-51614]|uniref:Acetyltransferase n=1 Tax=Psychrobacillus mangrovi TaxID=3117745 RepID=A0ABU8F199_9BACI